MPFSHQHYWQHFTRHFQANERFISPPPWGLGCSKEFTGYLRYTAPEIQTIEDGKG